MCCAHSTGAVKVAFFRFRSADDTARGAGATSSEVEPNPVTEQVPQCVCPLGEHEVSAGYTGAHSLLEDGVHLPHGLP